MRENVHQAAVNATKACHESIAGRTLLLHAEIRAAMAHEFVELFESVFIEQKMNALARGELACFMFALAALRTAARFGFRVEFAEFFHAVMMIGERLRNALRFRQWDLPEKVHLLR